MLSRQPEFIENWLSENQYRMDGPAQYLGNEPGSIHRDWDSASLRWLIFASWDYSQASGNMAIPAVYRSIMDADPSYLCERFYLPATPRDLGMLEKGGIPVFGIESKHQLSDFDVVGTSISYTVLFMNFCKMLSMSGIPLRWKDRRENPGDWPMVIVGGQAYCAPEFMAPVVDCVWLGEVEDEEGNGGIGEVCAQIEGYKDAGLWHSDRELCYRDLARSFPYLYFPRFMAFDYGYEDRGLPHPSKQVVGYRSTLEGMQLPLRARKVRNLDNVSLLTEWPVLYSDPAMGAGDIEAARGCPAWCTFCRLSWVTKPYRQEAVPRTIERARQIRLNQGSLELSPFGPDLPMHTAKKALLGGLLEAVSDEVDTSSLRVDDYLRDPDYALLLSAGGTDSLTFGVEGNSQRMRDMAGKGISDADIEAAVTKAIRAGIRKIKLYMINNWPGEEPGDVMKIVELGRRLAEIRSGFGERARGVRIQFSWTPLLIEAQTPLQWFAPTPPDYTLQQAMDELRDYGIDFKIGTKAQPNKLAFFQACQRASREVGEAIVDVLEELDSASWGGFAKDMKERLDSALIRHGFRNGLADIFGERYRGDLFGWEHISTGVSRRLLWDTYQRSLAFIEGTDADGYDEQFDENYRGAEWVARCDERCSGKACGVCSKTDLKLRQEYIHIRDRDLELEPVKPLDQTTIASRFRFKVIKPVDYRYVSAEAVKFIIRRAAYRAAEVTPFPAIAKRTVQLASDGQKYRERSAGVDYAEFGVTRPFTYDDTFLFAPRFAYEMQPWLAFDGSTFQIQPAQAKLPSSAPSLWELEVDEVPHTVHGWLKKWDQAGEVPVKIRTESFYAGVQTEDGDAKEHVEDFWLVRRDGSYVLRMVLNGKLGPYQAYAALAGKPSWISAARYPAVRLEFFGNDDLTAGDLFRPTCAGCGSLVPASLLGVHYDQELCPRCRDAASPLFLTGLERLAV